MANNKKISQLNSLSIATSADIFPIVDTGVPGFETKRITKANLMSSPGPIGLVNPDQGEFTILTLGGNPVNEFSTDGTLLGNSDTAVPTEKAVKSYVDTAVGNAVKLNIIHTIIDSTAQIGDIYLADTTNGDVNIELQATGEGKIIVLKDSDNANKVVITTSSGIIYDGAALSSVEITINYGSLEFLCDGTNFYVI